MRRLPTATSSALVPAAPPTEKKKKAPKQFTMVTRESNRAKKPPLFEYHEPLSKDGKLNMRSMYVAEAKINRLLTGF